MKMLPDLEEHIFTHLH